MAGCMFALIPCPSFWSGLLCIYIYRYISMRVQLFDLLLRPFWLAFCKVYNVELPVVYVRIDILSIRLEWPVVCIYISMRVQVFDLLLRPSWLAYCKVYNVELPIMYVRIDRKKEKSKRNCRKWLVVHPSVTPEWLVTGMYVNLSGWLLRHSAQSGRFSVHIEWLFFHLFGFSVRIWLIILFCRSPAFVSTS
jgi:hypothetical protein